LTFVLKRTTNKTYAVTDINFRSETHRLSTKNPELIYLSYFTVSSYTFTVGMLAHFYRCQWRTLTGLLTRVFSNIKNCFTLWS